MYPLTLSNLNFATFSCENQAEKNELHINNMATTKENRSFLKRIIVQRTTFQKRKITAVKFGW
jgi:hypothetical protein